MLSSARAPEAPDAVSVGSGRVVPGPVCLGADVVCSAEGAKPQNAWLLSSRAIFGAVSQPRGETSSPQDY